MRIFCVDPFLLACPHLISDSIKEFEHYLKTLISWGDFIEDNRDLTPIYISSDTPKILAEINGYPEWEQLEKTLLRLDLAKSIQPHDIHSIINNIILGLSCIEDEINIREVLFDTGKVLLEPSEFLTGRDQLFVDNYYRVFILECLLEDLNESCNIEYKILATRHLSNPNQLVTIKAQIDEYELCDSAKTINLNTPYTLEGTLLSCTDPSQISKFFNDSPLEIAISLWLNTEYEKAIRLYIETIDCQILKIVSDNYRLSYSFGSNFLDTVEKLGFKTEYNKVKKLLRSCSETILEDNLNATHSLRKNKGANSPQRERRKDQARAWRRDIDYEYHLHYWRTTENTIEFACVVIHNDMKIPE